LWMEHDVSDSFRTATRRAARSIPNTSTNDVRIFLILRITLLKYASQEPQQPQLAPATSGASRPVRLRHRHSIRNRRHDFSPSTRTHSSRSSRSLRLPSSILSILSRQPGKSKGPRAHYLSVHCCLLWEVHRLKDTVVLS
jgi:hypothetical protein